MQKFFSPVEGLVSKVYLSDTDAKLFDMMDTDQQAMKQQGFRMHKRVKVGRNAPCPCKSGLKFKKCCLNRVQDGVVEIR